MKLPVSPTSGAERMERAGRQTTRGTGRAHLSHSMSSSMRFALTTAASKSSTAAPGLRRSPAPRLGLPKALDVVGRVGQPWTNPTRPIDIASTARTRLRARVGRSRVARRGRGRRSRLAGRGRARRARGFGGARARRSRGRGRARARRSGAGGARARRSRGRGRARARRSRRRSLCLGFDRLAQRVTRLGHRVEDLGTGLFLLVPTGYFYDVAAYALGDPGDDRREHQSERANGFRNGSCLPTPVPMSDKFVELQHQLLGGLDVPALFDDRSDQPGVWRAQLGQDVADEALGGPE
jgi:hypothetical protein